jgi:hypothetical protein
MPANTATDSRPRRSNMANNLFIDENLVVVSS